MTHSTPNVSTELIEGPPANLPDEPPTMIPAPPASNLPDAPGATPAPGASRLVMLTLAETMLLQSADREANRLVLDAGRAILASHPAGATIDVKQMVIILPPEG